MASSVTLLTLDPLGFAIDGGSGDELAWKTTADLKQYVVDNGFYFGFSGLAFFVLFILEIIRMVLCWVVSSWWDCSLHIISRLICITCALRALMSA